MSKKFKILSLLGFYMDYTYFAGSSRIARRLTIVYHAVMFYENKPTQHPIAHDPEMWLHRYLKLHNTSNYRINVCNLVINRTLAVTVKKTNAFRIQVNLQQISLEMDKIESFHCQYQPMPLF